ncbi:TIGR02281 family clan AA aspartic protease [Sphingobium sp. AP49]|uniref:retropepsin-like aspartic protease family protein n=1 Tax=Sphingobium sp. AP49 TaxID=1144307 RepID=UPI00026ED50B|nr:TIGR02281 family clan AA aspartic protease [Sphingobium sp. AP49]WHO37227.1 TIGR02281 family clan AA aspartic protease [Sphingobium sp. AP49]
MNGTDQAMSSLWYLLALVLVGSALIGRRIALGSFVRMALLWVLIFGALLGLFTVAQKSGLLPQKFAAEGDRLIQPETSVQSLPQPPQPPKPIQSDGQLVRIPVASDGHYWVDGTINGMPVRFLIDSGATITALSENTARATGLNIDMNMPPISLNTANGKIEAHRASIATLAVGPLRASDVEVVVSPALGDVNVIGMNILSRLKSWSVENGEMVLTP